MTAIPELILNPLLEDLATSTSMGKSLQPEYAGLKIVRQNRAGPYSVPRSPHH